MGKGRGGIGSLLGVMVLVALPLQAQDQQCLMGEALPGHLARGRVPKELILPSATCSECHVPEGHKWAGGYRPLAFKKRFVQAEYRLAWTQSASSGDGRELPASCLACHSPTRYLTGDVPKPGEDLSKDEDLTCDFCHSMWGFEGKAPGQFNWIFRKGGQRLGPILPTAAGESHRFVQTPEFCGTCHDEQSPSGIWVKDTYLAWKSGPYQKNSKKGCLDCHQKHTREFVNSLIKNSVSLQVRAQFTSSDGLLKVEVTLCNQKAGHPIPGSSPELRQLWLHVEAMDDSGARVPLRVIPRGLEGEGYSIASDEGAYQDAVLLGGPRPATNLARDGEGIAWGDRIYREPTLDAEGRMTALEWNASKLGPDFRLQPLVPITEHFEARLPSSKSGKDLTIRAVLSYRRAPPALWSYLGLKAEDNPTLVVAEAKVPVSVRQELAKAR